MERLRVQLSVLEKVAERECSRAYGGAFLIIVNEIHALWNVIFLSARYACEFLIAE